MGLALRLYAPFHHQRKPYGVGLLAAEVKLMIDFGAGVWKYGTKAEILLSLKNRFGATSDPNLLFLRPYPRSRSISGVKR